MLTVLCHFNPNTIRQARISSTLSTTSGMRWSIINPTSLRCVNTISTYSPAQSFCCDSTLIDLWTKINHHVCSLIRSDQKSNYITHSEFKKRALSILTKTLQTSSQALVCFCVCFTDVYSHTERKRLPKH